MKYFSRIMLTFFVVYTLAVVLTVLSALAVERVDEFPPIPEFIQFVKSDVKACGHNTTVTIMSYTFTNQRTLEYIEAFRSTDLENPSSIMYMEHGVPVFFDIYVRKPNHIEWYQDILEYREAYPNGLCVDGTNL